VSEHSGLLAYLLEAHDIKKELDVPFEDALRIQRERAEERLREYQKSIAESNVIPFRPRPRGDDLN
jgi:hypothetical protein